MVSTVVERNDQPEYAERGDMTTWPPEHHERAFGGLKQAQAPASVQPSISTMPEPMTSQPDPRREREKVKGRRRGHRVYRVSLSSRFSPPATNLHTLHGT